MKISQNFFENWRFWKTVILKNGNFENRPFWTFFFKKKIAPFISDNTFWPRPNILKPSVHSLFNVLNMSMIPWKYLRTEKLHDSPSTLYFISFRRSFAYYIFVILGDGRHGGYFSHIWTHLSPPWSHFCQRKRNHYYLLCNDPIWQGQLAVKECKSL